MPFYAATMALALLFILVFYLVPEVLRKFYLLRDLRDERGTAGGAAATKKRSGAFRALVHFLLIFSVLLIGSMIFPTTMVQVFTLAAIITFFQVTDL
jgi:hypothetical protein